MMDPADLMGDPLIIFLFVIGGVVWSFGRGIYGNTEGKTRWILLGGLFLIAAIAIWYQWKIIQEDNEIFGCTDEEAIDVVESRSPKRSLHRQPTTFTHADFDELINDISKSEVNTKVIDYAYFKTICFDPEFLDNFHKSVKYALDYKHKMYTRIGSETQAELKTLKRKISAPSFASLQGSVADNNLTETLNNLHKECKLLLEEIRDAREILSIASVKASMSKIIMHPTKGIESMIGNTVAKDFIALQLYSFSSNPHIFMSGFQNMIICGDAGIGKTRLSSLFAYVYSNCGILIRNHPKIITKSDLTTGYVNESAKMTRRLLMTNFESVIHIDEAYDLVAEKHFGLGGADHGGEALVEMVNFIDKYQGCSVLIASGYEHEMKTRFIDANQGISRRFPHVITLTNYSSEDLTQILFKFVSINSPTVQIGQKDANIIFTYVDKLVMYGAFPNQAGDMENLSGYLGRSIFGRADYVWEMDSPENKEVIYKAFNDYVKTKSLDLAVM